MPYRVVPRGSSPLTRGTRLPHRSLFLCLRFIPAHAGNTARDIGRGRGLAVHPRSRGEHSSSRSNMRSSSGSSPLTRGTRSGGGARFDEPRFIPAHAGNTTHRRGWPKDHAVHPRSRGEHAARRRRNPSSTGSSPLTRGTLTTPRPGGTWNRFIPAHAGNTPAPPPVLWRCPVHPRSRGEHRMRSSRAKPAFGSSPLTRGTR